MKPPAQVTRVQMTVGSMADILARRGTEIWLFHNQVKPFSKHVLTKINLCFHNTPMKSAIQCFPKGALEYLKTCFGGLSLKVSAKEDTVVITASYINTQSGELAKVKRFWWDPESALNCSDKFSDKLIPGGESIGCTRNNNVPIAISINTDQASKTVWLGKHLNINTVRYTWDYDMVDKNSGLYICKNQDGQFGAQVNCHSPDYTCKSGYAMTGFCIIHYGSGYIEVDGNRTIQKHTWDYHVVGGNGSDQIQCTKDGKDIGNVWNCHTYDACPSGRTMTDICAGMTYEL